MRGIKYIYNYDGETEIKCKRNRNGGLGGKENGEAQGGDKIAPAGNFKGGQNSFLKT